MRVYLLTLSAFVVTFCLYACKKNSENIVANGAIKVKYEIISDLPFSNDPAYTILNNIGYTNGTYNVEMITNLSGKTWIKEFTIQEPQKRMIAVEGTVLLKGLNGKVTTKVYINGVVKSETNQTVQKVSSELSMATINAAYNL
ncbi:MAG: hypothetical protein EOP47_05150 [Sphingobacteriaceae bacterium]|nr:MAG: hypothetical protein EOP47_05150 [Sphingobacteriaceae bacterium]